MALSKIELSQLPAPEVVKQLDYEQILSEAIALAKQNATKRGIALDTISEADPLYVIAEVFAYRELLLRQDANEQAKALLIAFAKGADLTHLGVTYYDGEKRLVVVEEDNTVNPPVSEVLENDDNYLERLLMKDEGYSTAGAKGAFIFYARSASALVKDVSVDSPEKGTTVVYVLSTEANGIADQALINLVSKNLNDEDKRPLSELVIVKSAEIKKWSINVVLDVFEGPDTSLVLSAAIDALDEYKVKTHALGAAVTISGLHGALVVPGVRKAIIGGISEDLVCTIGEAPFCITSNVQIGVVND